MTDKFKEILPEEFNENVIRLIGKEWMLVTAGTISEFNTMTAAWGGLGFLWNMPISITFIRPQRYTYKFCEKFSQYTLSFFDERDKSILNYCGKYSGRDVDKVKETGLSVSESKLGNVIFEQSKIIMECTKLYFDDIKENNFLDAALDKKIYPLKDYHRMYIGKIDHIWIRK